MKKLLLIIFSVIGCHAFAQNWPVKQLVNDKKADGITFVQIPAFQFAGNRQLAQRGTYQELQLSASFRQQLMAQMPQAIRITIPLSSTQSITCELVKASLGNAKITENNGRVIPNLIIPVLYRGVVSGERQKNNVILTVTDGSVSLLATFFDKAIQIVQADSASPLAYRLYNTTTVQFPAYKMDCGTDESDNARVGTTIPLNGTITNRTNALQDKCVNVYVDCFDSLYQHFGSSRQQTLNYVYELFNLVTTGYINDSINIQLIGINVWTITDPFDQTTRLLARNTLTVYHKDNFWGNLCVGLDWSVGLGGLASGFGLAKATTPNACGVYKAADSTGATCYCDLNFSGNFTGFPTGSTVTQGQLAVTMHEMGHLLGSRHTHWCGWQLTPTVTGAIDSCASVENGPCATVGTTPPPAGGTIMSYCHLLSTSSIIYNNGFGLLPGNTIRNFVRNNTCISNCMMCLINGVFPASQNGDVASIPLLLNGYKQKQTILPDTSD